MKSFNAKKGYQAVKSRIVATSNRAEGRQGSKQRMLLFSINQIEPHKCNLPTNADLADTFFLDRWHCVWLWLWLRGGVSQVVVFVFALLFNQQSDESFKVLILSTFLTLTLSLSLFLTDS